MRALWVFFAVGVLAGQENAPVIRSTTEEVLLDVVVRDKKGRLVKDLEAKDFEITDEGAAQALKSFRLVQGGAAVGGDMAPPAAAAPAGASPAASMRQPRFVSMIFERLGVEGRQLSRQAALDFSAAEKDQDVYFGVFAIDHTLQVLQPYTRDRALVRKAVEKATSGTQFQFGTELQALEKANAQVQHSESEVENAVGPRGPAQGAGGVLADAKAAEMIANMLQLNAQMAAEEQARSSIFPLLSMVRGLMKAPGRKTVLYFSEVFKVPVALKEEFQFLVGAANRANVSFYAFDARGLLTTTQTAAGNEMLGGAARTIRSQNYTTRPKEVTREMVVALERAEDSIRADVQNNLAELAQGTGGMLVANSNDFRVPLRHVVEDIDTHYELSYSPGIGAYDGRFRRVAVKVKRPDVQIQARNGYFALPPGETGVVFPYEMPLLRALNSAQLPRAFEFQASAATFGVSAAGTECSLVLEVPLKGITFEADRDRKVYNTHLSLLAVLKNPQGEVVRKLGRNVPFQGPLDRLDAFRAGNFIQTEAFHVPAGRYTLETAVADRKGERVSARRSVLVVPAKRAGIGLSSISLVRRIEESAAAGPFAFDGKTVTPTLTEAFTASSGGTLSLYFVLFRDPGIEAKAQAVIEYLKDGAVVGRAAPELPAPGPDGRIPYVASSPLAGFTPGQYEVHVVARQGSSAAESWASFAVQP